MTEPPKQSVEHGRRPRAVVVVEELERLRFCEENLEVTNSVVHPVLMVYGTDEWLNLGYVFTLVDVASSLVNLH